ncbi:MAG TPA: hypothetical protein VGB59_02255 [Allosphingosinicella sp.]|jgi:hypothetical protein
MPPNRAFTLNPARVLATLAAAPLALLANACMTVREPVFSPCRAIASSDWQARIEPRSAEGKPPLPWLVVTGKVTVPSGGYTVGLDLGPVIQMEPPVQQVLVRTDPPAEGATQATVTHDVEAVFPAPAGAARVAIRCGDGILAEVNVAQPAAVSG